MTLDDISELKQPPSSSGCGQSLPRIWVEDLADRFERVFDITIETEMIDGLQTAGGVFSFVEAKSQNKQPFES